MATSEVTQEAEWEGGSGKFSSLRMQDTKKGPREKAVWSLDRVPGLRAVGVEVDALFDKFVEGTPGAASAGEGYGTEGFEIKHVDEWRQALENHFGVNSQPAGFNSGVCCTTRPRSTRHRWRPGHARLRTQIKLR